jgi:hypothetical protein
MAALHHLDVGSADKDLEIYAAFACRADISVLKMEEACTSKLLATLLTYTIY